MRHIRQKNNHRKGTYFLWFLEQCEKFVKRLRPDLIDY